MSTTLSENEKAVQAPRHEKTYETIVAKLYSLKEKFETLYYGKTVQKKYEKARKFTIQLNATLYEVNKMRSEQDSTRSRGPLSNKGKAQIYMKKHANLSKSDSEKIREKIEQLNNDLNDIILVADWWLFF